MKKIGFKVRPVILLFFIIIFASVVRVWGLDKAPVSLYWDEMDVGYQAYSIIHTGKDYFGNFLPINFHSYADFRAPVFIYSAIPFVLAFDLSAWAVRLPAAIYGIISIGLIYLVVKQLFESERLALLSAAVLAASPWHIQYSRMSFEATTMLAFFLLGVYGFFRGLKQSKWLIVSVLGFGLSMWSYSTAKLFVPLVILVLGGLYFNQIKKLNKKILLIAGAIFVIQLGILFFGNFLGGGGQRFSEIAIFTDPQIASQIDYLRFQSGVSHEEVHKVGLENSLWDKLSYNKPIYILDKFSTNYIKAFSTDFLFLRGDNITRHSPSAVGEMYRLEFLTLFLGLGLLIFKIKQGDKPAVFLAAWLLLSPIPSALTRDGGNHATRLFFLLPALVLIVSLGIDFLFNLFKGKRQKLVILAYIGLWLFGFMTYINFYTGSYKWESSQGFQYGFSEAVSTAVTSAKNYDLVVIDDQHDSALMNYLFYTKFDPGIFQKIRPSIRTELFPEMWADKIDNIYLMSPKQRSWWDIFKHKSLDAKALLIISAEQLQDTTPSQLAKKLDPNQKLLNVIYYPSGIPAFYVIDHEKYAKDKI